jgi:phospholipase D1/2
MPTEVTIKVPEPTFEGVVLSNKTEMRSETYPLPRTYKDATAEIERFESSANALIGRRNSPIADTVGQHALQDNTELRDEQWFGSEEEELNSYVFF